jgi:hypothetical protein
MGWRGAAVCQHRRWWAAAPCPGPAAAVQVISVAGEVYLPSMTPAERRAASQSDKVLWLLLCGFVLNESPSTLLWRTRCAALRSTPAASACRCSLPWRPMACLLGMLWRCQSSSSRCRRSPGITAHGEMAWGGREPGTEVWPITARGCALSTLSCGFVRLLYAGCGGLAFSGGRDRGGTGRGGDAACVAFCRSAPLHRVSHAPQVAVRARSQTRRPPQSWITGSQMLGLESGSASSAGGPQTRRRSAAISARSCTR